MGAGAFQRWISLLPLSASSANTAQVQTGPATLDEVDPPSLAVPDFESTVQERQEAWEGVRKHIEATKCAPFERHRDVDGVNDVAERFRLEWAQAKAFEGDVELAARRYGESLEQVSVPEGPRHLNFCLNVTPQALQSLGRYKQSDKDPQPFIQIVAPISTDKEYEENQRQLAEDLDETYPTRFNVALGSLLDGLLQIVGRQSLSLSELGGQLRDDEVWTSIS
ncbi:hypothetical protein GQ53DRAFT_823620 [Thozetella sp. PMI_491]|nr:hypothetical protein GQ53DRAFT_823620 [Thozetella sp. PMI_491]